jgi:hypothetical protein
MEDLRNIKLGVLNYCYAQGLDYQPESMSCKIFINL